MITNNARKVEKPEDRTAQVRVRAKQIVEGHSPGTILWMTPERAHMHNAAGVVEIIGAGPSEVKEGENEKRSFATRNNGRLTDFPESSPRGKVQQSFASAEGPVSHLLSASEFARDTATGESELSPLTTRTRSRRGPMFVTSRTRAGGNGIANAKRSRSSRA